MTPTQVARSSGQPAGSPQPGEPVFLVIGKLRRPHGLRGEMFMEVRTDFPERLVSGSQVYLGNDHLLQVIQTIRPHKDGLLIKFMDHNTPESVGVFRNHLVFASAKDIPRLPDGEFYHHQLIGLSAVNETGVRLGSVAEIIETGAHDVLVIKTDSNKEVLLPFVDSMIIEIDLNQSLLRIRPVPGIFLDDEVVKVSP